MTTSTDKSQSYAASAAMVIASAVLWGLYGTFVTILSSMGLIKIKIGIVDNIQKLHICGLQRTYILAGIDSGKLEEFSLIKIVSPIGCESIVILLGIHVHRNQRDIRIHLLEIDPGFGDIYLLVIEKNIINKSQDLFVFLKLLDLKPGLKVWDACAAPGGKSALMAEMDSSLDILASDVSENRVLKMHDVVDRLGLTNVHVECIDVLAEGVSQEDSLSSKFDRILLDVPCSNMGVIARRPEAVYRLSPDSIKELTELQYSLLESASKKLADGGILVYATCSPDPDETTKIINRFVKAHPEFKKRGPAVYPANDDARFDGFFAQALLKN